jgi:hypothetical protein
VVTAKGDLKKIRRGAEDRGWRVEKRKEYWLFYPIDKEQQPCRIAGITSSSRSWANFLSCMSEALHATGLADRFPTVFQVEPATDLIAA